MPAPDIKAESMQGDAVSRGPKVSPTNGWPKMSPSHESRLALFIDETVLFPNLASPTFTARLAEIGPSMAAIRGLHRVFTTLLIDAIQPDIPHQPTPSGPVCRFATLLGLPCCYSCSYSLSNSPECCHGNQTYFRLTT